MKFRWDKKYLYWGITALLVIMGGIAFYYLIFHSNSLIHNLLRIVEVSMPIIDGLILAYLMWPILHFLETKLLFPLKDYLLAKRPAWKAKEDKIRKACRGISIFLTLCFVLFLIYAFFHFIIPQLAASLRSIVVQFPTYILNFRSWLEWLLARYPEIGDTAADLLNNYSPELTSRISSLIPRMNSLVMTLSESMIGLARSLWNLIIGLIISVYLLGNKERFLSQAKKAAYALLETKHANGLVENARLIDATFGGFLIGKVLDSAIIGLICFVVVTIMGMPYPMLLSVIVGVTNIIPFFGPFIGAVPCAFLILVVSPMKSLYFIIFILVLQQFDGNFLGPRILGDRTGLSGFWVIFSITLFSGFFGVWGMVLGVPAFAVFYTLCKRKIEHNLKKKGMPVGTEEYRQLDLVDDRTGAFVMLKENEPKKDARQSEHWKKRLRDALREDDPKQPKS